MKANSTAPLDLTPVTLTVPADLLTPLAVYLKVSKGHSHAFLLESVEGNTSVARYSFIGAGPKSRIRSSGDGVELIDMNGSKKIPTSIFDFLRSHFANYRIEGAEGLPPFCGGAIGYIGFDCVDCLEPRLKKEGAPSPEAELMFFDSLIAFDHVKQEIKITSLFADLPDFLSHEEAEQQNERINDLLFNGEIELPQRPGSSAQAIVRSNFDQSGFEIAVGKIKELINAGECYQAVLSQSLERETKADAVSVYRALRSLNPSPYMYLLKLDKRSIVGSSPEMLVRAAGSRLEYRPIAGTRPRGANDVEDRRFDQELSADPKEIAEHMMLVDLGRNDLGRVAKFGSVRIDQLMKVEKYSHVQHLVSSLSAELRDKKDRFDAFAACFPAGTVSGAPKFRAIEIIRELEPTRRGIYAGAVGYFDYGENMDTCIAIRTIVMEDGVAKIQAGAGIVADSVPENEYMETVNKAKAMLRAIEIAEGQ